VTQPRVTCYRVGIRLNEPQMAAVPVDEHPLAPALPGQFIVLRLGPASGAPSLLRSYSLSGEPGDICYRVSVGVKPHGMAGTYIDKEVRVGDVVDVSAPRGSFVLKPGDGPVILLSAGIGATPVLAMLHALAAGSSPREVWWIHGSRNGEEHPFAAEARTRLAALAHGRSHIRYSSPGPADKPGRDFDAPGGLNPRPPSAGSRPSARGNCRGYGSPPARPGPRSSASG